MAKGGGYRTLLRTVLCLFYIPGQISCHLSLDFVKVSHQGGGPAARGGDTVLYSEFCSVCSVFFVKSHAISHGTS